MKTLTKLVVFGLMMAAVSVLGEAPASAVSVRFCFILDLDFDDWTDGDIWTAGYNTHAYGIRARVVQNQGGAWIYDDWVSTSGVACTSYLTLQTYNSYYIRLYSKARDDNGNTILVYTGSSGNTLHQQTVDWDYVPTASGTEFYVYEIINEVHETNVLGAASFAVREHPAGLSSHNFYFYTETPDGGGARHNNGYVYLDQKAKDWKTGTTHELGHLIGWKRDANTMPVCDYDDTGEGANCRSIVKKHLIDSREWQSAAAVEGIAHFYAAATWNDDSENDRLFRFEDCEGGTTGHEVDWLSQCDGTQFANKGNELDWLRFWWDMHTDESLTVQTIFEIWGDADPRNWTEPCVYERLRNAADDHGVDLDNWNAWASINGNNHGSCP